MHIFICTKPLQIMIAMVISQEQRPAYLFIVDGFEGSGEIFKSKQLLRFFEKTFFYKNRLEAIKSACSFKPESIFLDSDVGVRTHAQMCLTKLKSKKTVFNVYEEGVGTYRNDLVSSGFKRVVYSFLGAAQYFGGSIFTGNVYVFDTCLHAERLPSLVRKQVRIPVNFLKWMQDNKDYLLDVFLGEASFSFEVKDADAVVYLSDWVFKENVVDVLKGRGDLFIKPHPHIREDEVFEFKEKIPFAAWVPGRLPAEILIVALAEEYRRIYVSHNNSSSVKYLRGLECMAEL